MESNGLSDQLLCMVFLGEGSGRQIAESLQLKRAQVLPFFGNLTPCRSGMEACGSAYHWGRKLQALGHTVQLIPPQYVKPFVKRNKNDAADAEAICGAMARPNMPSVPIKTVEQQAILSLHRARQGFIKARRAQANQIRGLPAEFGLTIPQGIGHLATRTAEILEDAGNELPSAFRQLIQRLVDHLKELDRQVEALEAEIQVWHRSHAASQKLAKIPGIGPMTATAMVASIGDAKNFKNGRQLAAWLGLVPRQHSTGGKPTLLGISKRGDTYLRTLLIHGARAVLRIAERKPDSDSWLTRLLAEVRFNPNELSPEEVRPFVPRAAEIDQDKDRRLGSVMKILAECVSMHNAATWLMQNEAWDFFAVYFDAIDHFCHGFMKYHPPRLDWIPERDFELYRGVVNAAYEFHDMMLGTLSSLAGEDATVVLCSDHGFHPDHLRPRPIPREPAGPAVEHRDLGMFVMAGSGIRRDELVHGANVLDITPTLLAHLGLPVGDDMDGKPLMQAFETPPNVVRIPSWDAVPGDDGRHAVEVRQRLTAAV